MFAEDNAEVNVSIETLEKNIPNGNYYIFLRLCECRKWKSL